MNFIESTKHLLSLMGDNLHNTYPVNLTGKDVKAIFEYFESIENLYNIATEDLDKLQESYKELETQLANYKLDAERYRWLRHGDNDYHCIGHILTTDEYYLYRNKLLDGIIDNKMAREKEYYESLGVAYNE